jgi:hypothetical protein
MNCTKNSIDHKARQRRALCFSGGRSLTHGLG